MASVMDPINIFYQVYNEGKYELWNQALSESYTAEVNGHTIPNREVGLGFVKTFRAAFPNLFYTVDDAIIAGDKVTTRWTARGTHRGEFFGNPATGKDVTMIGITVFQVADGKIARLWNVWDLAGLLNQIRG